MSNKLNTEKIRQEFAKKYNTKIRELESEVRTLKIEKADLKLEVSKLKSDLEHKDEHIERILDYVNMDKEELDRLLDNERASEAINESLHNAMQSLLALYKPFRF